MISGIARVSRRKVGNKSRLASKREAKLLFVTVKYLADAVFGRFDDPLVPFRAKRVGHFGSTKVIIVLANPLPACKQSLGERDLIMFHRELSDDVVGVLE